LGVFLKEIKHGELKPGYDLVVVGAGAAGCSFLNEISSKFSVLCIDYREFPRFKACSGILVENSKNFFKKEEIPSWVFADKKPLDIIYSDWDNNLESHSKKQFYNIWRKNLDNWLFERIDNDSIHFLSSSKFVDFHYTSNKNYVVILFESNGGLKKVVCKYLIGCDGASSLIRKKIDNKEIKHYVAIQEVINCKLNGESYFIFDSEITDFYGWVISKGRKVEVGCAVLPYKAREKFELFKNKVKKRFGIVGNGVVESALVLRPKEFSDILLGKKNVFLCGEAAALISPSSAEGISYALLSGSFCAEAINNCFDKDPLKKYKDNCAAILTRLKAKFNKSKILSDVEHRKSLFKK
jgi:flavin-dependent dehydrogenase